ncbi:MAG: SusD/RagB family nutrient-binding outer membrane lipoprotein [Saprospiraceae bacterium]
MKKIINSSLILIVLVLISSCSKFVEGYDVSPNAPSDAPPVLLLPAIQVSTFSNLTGKNARDAGVLTQQLKGALFQAQELESYALTESSVDGDWAQIYSLSIVNCNVLINKSDDKSKTYRGIARIMKAMNLGLATDLWGDVPNSEAGLGQDGKTFNAKFDSQEDVIKDIQKMLSDAIADLGSASGDIVKPGADDLVYGGDAKKWIGAAWVLKARYANRLSKKNPAGSATDAINFLAEAYKAGFTSSASNCNAVFDNTAANSFNQWKAYDAQRAGYLTMNKNMMDLMTGLNDPRLSFYAKDKTMGDKSAFGEYARGEKMPMVSFMEAKFIEAEANLRAGAKDKAAAAQNEAVKASILLVTGAATSPFADETAATITQGAIMTHKYIAMFTQPEVYNDWRRTNIPALTPNAGATVNFIPRRYPTALTERLYNTKAVVNAKLDDPVWWDK